MRSTPIAILRCKWKDHANAAPTWPDNAYTGCFLPIRPGGVARYWQDRTFGLLNLEGSVVYPWRVLDLDRPTGKLDFDVILAHAIEKCLDAGFPLHQFPYVIVFVIPTPPNLLDGGSTRIATHGGSWSCALHFESDAQDYFAHEAGHVLGFDHSWGRPPNGPPIKYADPYCVMSAQNYAGANPVWVATADPAMPVHSGYWAGMAPSPAGATLYQYLPEFATAGYAVELGANFSSVPQSVHLHALDTGRKPCVAVVTIPAEGRRYTIEYRRRRGWDVGVEPAVVMHSIEPAYIPEQAVRAVYEGRIRVPHQGDPIWYARNKKIAVLLDEVSADGSAVDVMIASVGLVTPLYVAMEIVEGGASELAEEGNAEVFVPPNCGPGQFHFFIDHQDTVIRCKASALGFEKPEFSWSVNGVPVVAGGGLLSPIPTLSIPVVARFPGPNAETTKPRIARIQYDVKDDALVLTARSQDGNYLVDVAVIVTESEASSTNFGKAANANGSAQMAGIIVSYETAFYEAVVRCASRDLKSLLETYADLKLRFVREEGPLSRNIAVLGQWQHAAATRNPMLAEQIGWATRVLTNLQELQSRRLQDKGAESL